MIPVSNVIPTYPLILPSTGKKLQYRPFIEKERKIMLMALAANNKEDTLEAIKKVIVACCPDINMDTITLFDIEYIFIQLRAKSVGEIMKLKFICHSKFGNAECGRVMQPEVDITTAEVVNLRKDLKIPLSPYIGVKMKYPGLGYLENIQEVEKSDYIYALIANSIEFIWEKENIYYVKDYTSDDLMEFIMHLTHDQFKKLEDFVSEIPTVQKIVHHKCDRCGFEHVIKLEGYQSFFI